MISITLPDGSKKEFEGPVTVKEVAASIGAGLAKAAIAGKVNGKLVDTSYPITEDATLSIVTDKDPEGLDIIRHSTSHLMAQAVKEISRAHKSQSDRLSKTAFTTTSLSPVL